MGFYFYCLPWPVPQSACTCVQCPHEQTHSTKHIGLHHCYSDNLESVKEHSIQNLPYFISIYKLLMTHLINDPNNTCDCDLNVLSLRLAPLATESFCVPLHWFQFWKASKSFQFNDFYLIPATLSTYYGPREHRYKADLVSASPCSEFSGTLLPWCSPQLPFSFFHRCFLLPDFSLLSAIVVPARLVGDLSGVSEIPLLS